MARGNNDREQGTEKGKIRVLFIELEGNNQTLQDGLRTVSQMLPRAVEVKIPPKLVQNGIAAAASNARPAEPDLFNQESAAPEVIDPEEVEQPDAGAAGSTRKKRGEGTKTERNAGISPVADLDFVPKDKPALKAFFAEKAPATDMEQVLVVGYYLKQTLGLATFGPGHIFAGFKHVNKPIPVDLRQTMRNMKPMVGTRQGKGWLNFTEVESARLTTEGENVVEHELPRKGSRDTGGSK
jgi:hypothetical protein